MVSIFLNRSWTRGISKNDSFPKSVFATSLMQVYGDISKRQNGVYIDDKYVDGPLPIDLPNIIISDSFTPTFLVRYS